MDRQPQVPELTIVIVSWNTRARLAQCLESLYSTMGKLACQVIVVDNGSQDGTVQQVAGQFPQVERICNSGNRGFAAANNQGLRQARGRYVALLNPDTVVKPHALERLVEFLEHTPRAGGVAPKLLNADSSLQVSCEPLPTLQSEWWRLFHLDRYRRRASYDPARWSSLLPQRVGVARGACLVLRRELFEQLGWLDENFFMYSEEVDLCKRLHDAGWELYWLPTAEVVHYGGESTRQAADTMFIQLYRGKLQYFRKHNAWLGAQTYRLILLAATLCRLALSPFALLESPARREQHLALTRQYGKLLLKLAVL